MKRNAKIFLISLLLILGLTTTLSAKKSKKQTIIGKTYLVKSVNGQSIDYGDLLQMFITFEKDELKIELVSQGKTEETVEEIEYDPETGILIEFTEEGEVENTIEFDGDTVIMTGEGETVMILEEVK